MDYSTTTSSCGLDKFNLIIKNKEIEFTQDKQEIRNILFVVTIGSK
jgi:hypothetical protein